MIAIFLREADDKKSGFGVIEYDRRVATLNVSPLFVLVSSQRGRAISRIVIEYYDEKIVTSKCCILF